MKIALIADLHGNWTATKALEKDLIRRKIDTIYCLGDLVGKGPSNDKTFDWTMANSKVIIGGNWDYGVGEKLFPADGFYWEQLGEKRLTALRNLPKEHHMNVSGFDLRLFHGRPVTPDKVLNPTVLPQELTPYFENEGKTFDGVIYADWHRAFYRVLNSGIIINTGSVGNSIGVPNVFYAIIEGEENAASSHKGSPLDVTIVSLPYNNQKAVQEAQESNMPNKDLYIQEILTGIYAR